MVWFSLTIGFGFGFGACGPAGPTDATATLSPEETAQIETLDTTARLEALAS